MPISQKDTRSGRAFAMPLFGVALLLGSYLLLADWRSVPAIITSALAAVHLPALIR